MFNFLCKSFPHLNRCSRTSHTQKWCFLQLSMFFSPSSTEAKKPILDNGNQDSFTVNYLIKTCGFDPEKALSASKYLNFGKADKPNAVISLLQEHGFTKTQITSLVRRFPPVILCDPDKTILPKIEFFRSKGFSQEDISLVLSRTPNIFKRSLENQIIPTFNLFNTLIPSHDKIVSSLKRFGYILCCDLHTTVLPNIEALREVGVPDSNIAILLTYQPRDFTMENAKFRLIVEEVKEIGFDPSKLKFLIAVHAFRAMSKLTWEKKVEVYKKWGWSDDEVIVAFGKHPWCMMASVDKITKVMDFFVNKMGFGSSVLLRRPALISLSLNQRIVPRCRVYEVLTAKGLIQKDTNIGFFLEVPERNFRKKYVEIYSKEAPELLILYKKILVD